MSFRPVVPFGGYAGWKFLARTMDKQQAAFVASVSLKRDEDYFREKIGSVKSADNLTEDRRLLRVALGAFGLDGDINNKFFIRKVLEDGTMVPDALANKLANKSYREFSKAFGFGDYSVPRTQLSDFADKILGAYRERQFEMSVGQSNDSMRLALNAQRELPKLAAKDLGERTKWFEIIGSPPLMNVVRTALGLPKSLSAIDVDLQVGALQRKSRMVFGTSDPAKFADPANLEKLIKQFLLRSDLQESTSTSQSNALQLLQASTASGGRLSILL